MHALVFVLLAAAPVDMIVVDGPEVKAALTTRLAAATPIDASAMYAYLHLDTLNLDPSSIQDFSGFSAPPIAGWPPELAGFWNTNLARCRKIAGPKPYRDTLLVTLSCAQHLSKLLWQKYLDHLAPRRVYQLRTGADPRKGTASAWGTTYEVWSSQQVTVSEEGSPRQRGELIERAATALVALKGKSAPREVALEPAPSALSDPLTGEEVVTTPVALKKSCDALPGALTFNEPSVLGKTIAARWAASAKATGPARACTIDLTRREETNPVMGTITLLVGVLECGDQTASAESMAGKIATSNLSAQLINKLAARLCK